MLVQAEADEWRVVAQDQHEYHAFGTHAILLRCGLVECRLQILIESDEVDESYMFFILGCDGLLPRLKPGFEHLRTFKHEK